ncbi:DUF5777 family beta-barrel protein [Taibaiella chishuiensis]|uniref:DUF5777 domain-containing protein n=1 Tax=Taibaiella chishuiensis TaxID=1434707 RepID=A0A2P8D087_9BACT|nr:DUF5777 family beta-barrel protein [Taibaiella chishuiensis]PSK90617.1 hypothetical protein B0I18_10727 [Taibaiella chishuiensis]
MQLKFILFPLVFSLAGLHLHAQETNKPKDETEDLMKMLESETDNKGTAYTTATFKTTRIANGHSIENLGKGVLDFRINHRFGRINQGFSEFFGLDNASTRIGFDYGITDWLMVGIGRSTYLKDADGFVKARILRQTDNDRMPLSLSYVGAMSIQATELYPPPAGSGIEYKFSQRVAYINQLLIARKFANWLSLQLMPTHIHYNFVQFRDDPNDVFAIGLGGRIKLSNRIALTGEYYMVVPPNDRLTGTRNSLTLGFDIETGGHVFQLLFSNSTGITERTVIGQTTGGWDKGDIHFGFNISRVFTVVKPKGFESSRNKIW